MMRVRSPGIEVVGECALGAGAADVVAKGPWFQQLGGASLDVGNGGWQHTATLLPSQPA